MKQNFLIIILIISLSACKDKQQTSGIPQTDKFYPEVEQRSVIFGQIENINEFTNAPREIELCVDEISINHQESYETTIDDSGRFLFDIPLYHPINTYLNYGDARITPYLFPNDTLYLKCKIGKRGFQIGIESGTFDDKHDRFENEFFKQYEWLHYDKLNPFREQLSKELIPSELKDQYLNFEKDLKQQISERVIKDSLDQNLAKYLNYSTSYSIYQEIIEAGDKIVNKEEKQQFFAFLTDSIVFNKSAMVTSEYGLFLSYYKGFVEAHPLLMVNTSGKSADQIIIEFNKKAINNAFKVRNGKWAEMLAASQLYAFAFKEEELTKTAIDSLDQLIQTSFTNDYIKQLLLSLCNRTGKKVEEINLQEIPTAANLQKYDSLSGEQLYNKILSDRQGKVIYIDIWATWCSPCKKQISHSIRMHEMLKDKNVSFVYLCCDSKEDIWKNVIRQYQMTGDQIFLNKEQYAFWEKKFAIHGIPRFILVDKKGKIIDRNAPRPSSEEILERINKLLE